MTGLFITAGVVTALVVAAGAMWWIVRRLRDQDRRIAELDSHVSDLGVVASNVIDKAEEHPRRRRFRVFRAVEVAVPVMLLAGVAMAADAIASRDSEERGEPRLTPTTIPQIRSAPPAEEDQPVMPDVATLPTMRPPGAPAPERTTEAEVLPPSSAEHPRGNGGGGLSVDFPPDASPPSSPPGEPPVAVELPEPAPPSGTPRVAGETGPAPLVDLGVLNVTVERT